MRSCHLWHLPFTALAPAYYIIISLAVRIINLLFCTSSRGGASRRGVGGADFYRFIPRFCALAQGGATEARGGRAKKRERGARGPREKDGGGRVSAQKPPPTFFSKFRATGKKLRYKNSVCATTTHTQKSYEPWAKNKRLHTFFDKYTFF